MDQPIPPPPRRTDAHGHRRRNAASMNTMPTRKRKLPVPMDRARVCDPAYLSDCWQKCCTYKLAMLRKVGSLRVKEEALRDQHVRLAATGQWSVNGAGVFIALGETDHQLDQVAAALQDAREAMARLKQQMTIITMLRRKTSTLLGRQVTQGDRGLTGAWRMRQTMRPRTLPFLLGRCCEPSRSPASRLSVHEQLRLLGYSPAEIPTMTAEQVANALEGGMLPPVEEESLPHGIPAQAVQPRPGNPHGPAGNRGERLGDGAGGAEPAHGGAWQTKRSDAPK